MAALAVVETKPTACSTFAEARQALAASGGSEPRLVVTSDAELGASFFPDHWTEVCNTAEGMAAFEDFKPVRKFSGRRSALVRRQDALWLLGSLCWSDGRSLAHQGR